MENEPEFLEFATHIGNTRLNIRVERVTAEDDLGVETMSGDQFKCWQEANFNRLVQSATHKRLQNPFRKPGADSTVVLRPGDLLE